MDITFEIRHRSHKTKHTKVGDIPKDWDLDKLRKNAIVLFSNVDKHIHEDEIPVFLCNYQDVYYHDYINSGIPFSAGSVKPSEFRKFQLHKGDVIITKDSEDRKDIAVPAYVIEEIPNLICGYHLAILRPNESRLDGIFLSFLLQSHNINHYFQKLANGVTRFGLTTDSIKNALIPIPQLPEQQKIAEILSTWDQAIATTQSLIGELKIRRKGLMQQIFKGNLRLKGKNGSEYPEWKPNKLSHYLKVSKAKNEGLKYSKDDVLSVSGEYGIVNQIEFHGRSFAGASVANYGVVETGDIVYTKSPLKANPYGIIKVNKGQAGIVSTLYAIYKCKPTVNGEFVDYYFQLDDNVNRYLRPLVQKGTKNDMKINNEKVLIDEVLFPSLEEQNAIVDFFKTIDNEIIQTQKYLESLKKQKKGLMQKLLTGEIRVKTE